MSRCKSSIRWGVNILPIQCRLTRHDHDEDSLHTGHKAWWRWGSRDKSLTWWGDAK